MGLRAVTGDLHYQKIGFGTVTLSGADTFSAAQLPKIAEPTFIVKDEINRAFLEVDVEDVLIWDNRKWEARAGGAIDFAVSEDKTQTSNWGVTKDNTSDGSDAPTSDAIAQGTRPGGKGAAVTGAAAGGGDGGPLMNSDDIPTRYVARGEFFAIANEENAVGEINQSFSQDSTYPYEPYQDSESEHSVHYLMTAAHYHAWLDTAGTGITGNLSLGADVRKMAIDLQELMFDRQVILSILDALTRTR